MSETAPEAPAQEPTDAESSGDQPTTEKVDDTDWKAEARKWEERAKENRKARDEIEKQRRAAMTETERAVAEAEERGRTAAVQEYGKRLATAEIRAAASTAGADLAGVFDFIDLGRFVGEDGEPDTKAIGAFVDGLPKRNQLAPGLDLGAQRGAPATQQDFNQALRRAAGRA